MKILYVTTISNTVNAFLIPHIRMLVEQGNQVDVAFNIEQEVNPELIELGCKIHQVEFRRSPLKLQNFKAYNKLKQIIINEKYDIVHTHTPIASAFTRIACKNINNLRVFYTAHGFHFYRGSPLLNWLIYFPLEKWLSRYTDLIITINQEDYKIGKKYFNSKEIKYIPGVGIDLSKYKIIEVNKSQLLADIEVPLGSIVLISVGELNKNKNHESIIKAISKLNNPDIYYIICGNGPLEKYLNKLVVKLGLEKNVKFLGYRSDIPNLLQIANIFIFPSFREGLSVALMEAMACSLPAICSDIRGNRDLILDNKGGYLIEPNDFHGFSTAIKEYLHDSSKLVNHGEYNKKMIINYNLENILQSIKKIYD